MSRTLKIVLGVIGGLLVLCLCALVVGGVFLGKTIASAVKSDPVAARAEAASIADFSMPAGYGSKGFSFSLSSYKIAAFTSEQGGMLMLMSLPAGTSQAENEQMVQQIGSSLGSSVGQGSAFTETGRREITVRGQPAEVVLSEGTSKNGERTREEFVTFVGKNGPAVLVLIAPVSQWDGAEVDRLVASIH